MTDESNEKRGRGRPPRPLPERIPATPEQLARVLVTTPPKMDWEPKKPAPDSS